jgi:hypothetical protein
MTELMLKERDLNIKENDSVRNERITIMQMTDKKTSDAAFKDTLGG